MTYETLSQAVNDLQRRGYTEDFKMKFDCLECEGIDGSIKPEEFMVDEVYRFEGKSNPDDTSIVFAISTSSGHKGVLVDAYGAYSDPVSIEMIEKFQMPNRNH